MGRRVTTRDDATAVITLYKAGHTIKEISSQTGVNERSCQRLVKQFRDEGGRAIPTPKPRPGRPRLISPTTAKLLGRQIKANPRLTAGELKELNPQLLSRPSLRCVQQCLHDVLKFRSFRARKKPLLTSVHKKKRVSFAKKYQVWDLSTWRKVLWSDEATFNVTGSADSRVYRPPNSDPHDPRYTQKTVKHPASLMVWGCFTYYGVGDLVILPKNEKMNQYNYLELLLDHLPSSFDNTKAEVFMQDGAPCHTAKSVQKWLCDSDVKYFKDWPGNSPDLNPIENLWSIIKSKLRNADTSSLPKLEAAIRHVWDNFKPELLQNLADSVPKRLEQCIKAKGNATKY